MEYLKYTEKVLMIAKFMGLDPIKGVNESTGGEYYYYNNAEMEDYEGLPFYHTWQELMPVVTKIISLDGSQFCIDKNWITFDGKRFEGKDKLKLVQEAVIWKIQQLQK